MIIINQKESIKSIDNLVKAEKIINETKVLTIARLAKMLIDLFGSDKAFKKIGKRAGNEIELYFKEIDEYITFILSIDRKNFECNIEKAKNPISKVIITVREDKILQVFSNIVRLKNNIFGLIKLLKYIVSGKIKIKGSYVTTIKWAKTIMIGKHSIYKNN